MSSTRLDVRLHLPLDRFDLDLAFGASAQVTGVFGPSGAGKSSLLKAIAGIEHRRSKGRIGFDGETWLDSESGVYLPPERRGIGYVPQEGLLFPHLDVRRNLTAGARGARAGAESTFDSVCELLRLGPLLDRQVETLSGGERQRVALGRALCSRPRLLLLDEPLASLDLPLRRRVLPFLRRIRDELDLPMLLVTHEPTEVQALCDEVIALDAGRIVDSGPVREVFGRLGGLVRPEQDFENVLPCVLLETSSDTSRLRIGGASDGRSEERQVELVTTRVDAAVGSELLVGIPTHEITLATEAPAGISASNAIEAEITAIQEAGRLRLVRTSIGVDDLDVAVTVTERACGRLGLAPGKHIYLIIKATACILYG
jgi:molybdate transport system ATP-binding protein